MPGFEFPDNIYSIVFLVLFLAGFLVTIMHYWLIFRRIAFYRKPSQNISDQPVSVVICARNQEEALKHNLPLILNQDHSCFEVVVVNDASEDETDFLLENFSREFSNLKIVNIPQNLNFFQGKKFPLSIGIKSAMYDILLLTNADCRPESTQWISKIQQSYFDHTDIVLCHAPYMPRLGFFNTLVRFDAFHDSLHYLSWALAGQPYKGIGRNLSYRKSHFYRNKGFIDHYTIRPGDDDLFINQTAARGNTAVNIDPLALVYTKAPTTFTDWSRLKKNGIFTSRFYKNKHRFLKALYYFGQFSFYAGTLGLLVLWNNPVYVAIFILVKFASQLIVFKKGMIRLNEKDLLLISPVLEVMLLIINASLSLSLLVSKKSTWK